MLKSKDDVVNITDLTKQAKAWLDSLDADLICIQEHRRTHHTDFAWASAKYSVHFTPARKTPQGTSGWGCYFGTQTSHSL